VNVFGKAAIATFLIFCRLSAFYAAQPDSRLEAAIDLIHSGRLEQAEEVLNGYLSEPSPPVRALYWKGYVQFASKRYSESVLTLNTYLERSPEDAQARKVLGLNLFMLGDAAAAQTTLERAVQLNPSDGESRYYLGRVYFERQNMPAALAAFKKLLELEPRSVRAHNHLGQTYEALNEFAASENAYQTAIRLDSDGAKPSEWPHYNLGVLYLNAGRAAEALPHLARALQIRPKFSEARLKRAVALAATGNSEQAKTELESLTADEPDYADAHYQIGRLYNRLGDLDKASKHLLLFQRLKRP
jgi:tetratricopeptide (TPR) repeat protein